MSTNIITRIHALERRIGGGRCQTCSGHAFAIVMVPEGEDEDAAEWNPTHCLECGVPLRTVRRIIGISDAEMDWTPERAG